MFETSLYFHQVWEFFAGSIWWGFIIGVYVVSLRWWFKGI